MAGPVKYLSGRQNKLKIGIPDYNQETTTLQVFGRVGVGTTNATSDLYVKGGGEFTGVVTATKFDGAFENITLTGVTTTQQFNTTIIESETINITGISTFGDIVNLIGSTAGITSISFAPSTNTITFLDNAKAKFGDGGDLTLYHDSNISRVQSDNKPLYIKGAGINFYKGGGSELFAKFVPDEQVEFYYNNGKRLETTGVGASCVGIMSATSFVKTGGTALPTILNCSVLGPSKK